MENVLICNLKLDLFILTTGLLCWVAHWFQLFELHCKLCRCIGQTPCSVEHYLVITAIITTKQNWRCCGRQTYKLVK